MLKVLYVKVSGERVQCPLKDPVREELLECRGCRHYGGSTTQGYGWSMKGIVDCVWDPEELALFASIQGGA